MGCCETREKDVETPKGFLREMRRLTIGAEGYEHLTPRSDDDGTFSHHFATNSGDLIDNCYKLDKDLLGQGSHGVVRKAESRSARAHRAVKSISLEHLKGNKQQMLNREINIMMSMDHPHIIKLYETFKDAKFFYLVMELCTGGEFFDRIVQDAQDGFEEHQASVYMRQILSAVCYVHKHRVVHRDIKPENFLLEDVSERAALKLIDFGVATIIKPGQMLRTTTGTASYVAPEVLQGHYNELADIWSCGIICFILLSGAPPFSGSSPQQIMKQVRKSDVVFKSPVWDHVSDTAKALVNQMLERQVSCRPPAEELLRETWFEKLQPKRKDRKVKTELLSSFKTFHQAHKFKRMAITMMATMLEDDDIKDLREQFLALDIKGDGSISKEELAKGLKEKMDSKTVTYEELEELMEGIDSDGSGEIDWTEFLAAALDKRKLLAREVMWNAFRRFDLNGDGKITTDELRQVITNGDYNMLSGDKLQDLIEEADEDGDGSIDFNEFMHMMQRSG